MKMSMAAAEAPGEQSRALMKIRILVDPRIMETLDKSGTLTRSQKSQTFENRPGIIAVSARTPSDNGVRTTACGRTLTDEAEDVAYAGDEDDQDVGSGQQDHGDDGVADPAELLLGAQQVVDRRTDLCEGGGNRLGPV